MYHGAEHKCINCIEHGLELNVENVRISSSAAQALRYQLSVYRYVYQYRVYHGIQYSAFYGDPCEYGVLADSCCVLLLLPVIAGVSYEFIRLAGYDLRAGS